ncbi:MAG: phage integrase N-terminal SAM-like domain-containing protein [Opitutaceae bacterium]|nr:phage integrase N-terminal SAM-like domain-containing protein [Opitutaceae bacterium]
MALSKSTRQVSAHASTRRGGARAVHVPDSETLVRFAETLKLRSLARATQDEYLQFLRKLAAHHGGDPAGLDEAQVRAHLLRLKDERHYSPSCDAHGGLGHAGLLRVASRPRLEAVRPGALAVGAKAAGGADARGGGTILQRPVRLPRIGRREPS